MGLGAHGLGQSRVRYQRAGWPVSDILRSLLGGRAAWHDLDFFPRADEFQRQSDRDAAGALARSPGGPPWAQAALVRHLQRAWSARDRAAGGARGWPLGLGAGGIWARQHGLFC